MPFRAKVKKVFGRNGSGSNSDSSSLKPSKTTESNTYGPDEPIPKPKYRAPVDPKHKETLESFSFENAFRSKSTQSLYSPLGSRMPSRNNSLGDDDSRTAYTNKRNEGQFGQLAEDDETRDVMVLEGTRNHSIADSTAYSGPPGSSTNGSTSTEGAATAGVQKHSHAPDQGQRPITEPEATAALKLSTSRRPHS